MTRLQTKCLFGSACFHGLTVVVFLATAAFRSEPTITEEQVLTLVNIPILDRPGVGGEPPPVVKPQPTPAAAQPAAPQTPPQPAPPTPPTPQTQTPTPPTPSRAQPPPAPATPPKPVTATTARQPDAKPAPTKPAPGPSPTRRAINVDLTQVTSSTKSPSRSAAAAAAAAAAAQTAINKQLAQEIAGTYAALGSSVQSKAAAVAVVPLPGEGGSGGGEAFVNYRTAIFNAYYQAWKTPESTTRRTALADVRIVVARNGDIISSEFVSKSGDSSVDQSIQRALDLVERQKLPPFPAGAEDTPRTFIIRFNLEAKQSAG